MTIGHLLELNDVQTAEKLRKEFRFNEKLFFRLRLSSLAKQGNFTDFEKLVEKRGNKLIGYDQIIKICADNQRNDEGLKLISKCSGKVKVSALLYLRQFLEGAEEANRMNDVDLIAKCYRIAQQFDPAVANQISEKFAN